MDVYRAAEKGNSVFLASYLHAGGDPLTISPRDTMGWSLLHLAVGYSIAEISLPMHASKRLEPDNPDGHATCVSLLLAAGMDPNQLSKRGGYTALIGACLSGDVECCRLLLQAGARTDHVANDGFTVFVRSSFLLPSLPPSLHLPISLFKSLSPSFLLTIPSQRSPQANPPRAPSGPGSRSCI